MELRSVLSFENGERDEERASGQRRGLDSQGLKARAWSEWPTGRAPPPSVARRQ
jgi:hypothetical protein